MTFQGRYERNKQILLNDKTICKENRELWKDFFDFEEVKLKRINGLQKLDERAYKTLVNYVVRFRNVNSWFKNKAWKDLTEKELEKVFNDLEDGKIKNNEGKAIKGLNKTYYAPIFKSKPFEMAGKKEIAMKVMEFFNNKTEEEVRFIEEETFMKIADVAISPKQKCLLWLAWDIGENIGSLLELKKENCFKQENKDMHEWEYRINLPKEILKRSRTPRSEITNYKQTAKFLDIILADLKNDDKLFDFGVKQAEKFLRRAVNIVKAVCIPKGQRVSWKDLRSSMACHLLKEGWNSDEINARLGHKPSSRVLDKYVSYKAMNRHEPKKKIYDNNLRKMQDEMEKQKEIERLQSARMERIQQENKIMKEQMEKELEIIRENLNKLVVSKGLKSK